MAKKTNLDKYITHTDLERSLVKLGVPAKYWQAVKSDIRFRATMAHGESVSTLAQRQWMMKIAMDPRQDHSCIFIGSSPTDEGGLYMAFTLLRRIVAKGYTAGVINLGNKEVPYFEEYPHLLVFYNLKHDASPERCERLRDLLIRFRYSSRLVTVAGCKDPFRFALDRVNIYPRTAMLLSDRKP